MGECQSWWEGERDHSEAIKEGGGLKITMLGFYDDDELWVGS